LRTLDWLRNTAPTQRWFADKTRKVVDVQVAWQESITPGHEIAMVVAEYHFSSGPPGLYFLPIDTVTGEDASARPEFTTWLLDTIAGRQSLPERLTWSRLTTDDLTLLPTTPGKLLGVEQSNTSIRYGDHALIKLNRRLTIGLSPEAELAGVIAKANDASFAARIYGTLMWNDVAEAPACVAICSEFVPNLDDGWGYLLSRLTDPDDRADVIRPEIEQIADVTAAMHLGLTSDPWRTDVSPEPISTDDMDRWEASGVIALEQLVRDLTEHAETLDPAARRLAELLPTAAPILREQLHGRHSLRGTFKIRVHGDYHLAQLLRKPDGGYVVVDFDGEPNRSLSERRDKYSALRDVAGMLRSFAYARGTAERSDRIGGRSASWLEWERRAREQFLARYQERMSGQQIPLIPAATDDMRLALAALELEKAIYECGYELSNRPDWLWLPLSRLVRAG
jgi:maltokinase